ncbi:MAG: MFS transporter [Actinobacteria bacterium]|nr:MFS transporter [Actinomycetota bacterium]MCL6104367.1 MFS transporter [Actinomycetota bacterium]
MSFRTWHKSATQRLLDFFKDAFDQKKPLGRLTLTHVFMMAGDTLVTFSLAGSLFFSLSPNAAKDKVMLYLLFTMAPFAVVAPFLSPLLDKGKKTRPTIAFLSAIGRGVLCLFMSFDLKSFLLFPEAFGILVLSKLYLITKSSLVPATTSVDELASANSRLALLASLGGFLAGAVAAGGVKTVGAVWVLRLDILLYLLAAILAVRLVAKIHLPRIRAKGEVGRETGPQVVSQAGSEAVPEPAIQAGEQVEPLAYPEQTHRKVPAESILAGTSMSVLRGSTGFLAFWIAFVLKREDAPLWWYAVMLAGNGAGSVVGSMSVPRLRKLLTEQHILLLSLIGVTFSAIVSFVVGGLVIQLVLMFFTGFGAMAAKPSFDALVQKHLPHNRQGRAFARFETRFQLVWVLGALLALLAPLSLSDGDVVMAVVNALTAVSYVTSRRALAEGSGGG